MGVVNNYNNLIPQKKAGNACFHRKTKQSAFILKEIQKE